jgi:hypothetical protein
MCTPLYQRSPNLSINMWRTNKNYLISLSKAWISTNQCAKLENVRHYVGAYSYKNHTRLTTFCFELLYQMTWDCGKHRVTYGNGRGLHLPCSFHYLVKNAYWKPAQLFTCYRTCWKKYDKHHTSYTLLVAWAIKLTVSGHKWKQTSR